MAQIPRLSICIATFNRGAFIGATLDSILSQMQPGVELVVVDGASPDDTPDVMAGFLSRVPTIRYFREAYNSGVEADYDKAVGYATGDYCWLMADDDLLVPGAIARVLARLDDRLDLLVVNSELWNADLSRSLGERTIASREDKDYVPGSCEQVFIELADCLSYIASVIVKRLTWLARDRSSYYGTLFVQIGVIFQHPPMERVATIADPLIMIRYGNGMWTPRSFEIWNLRWPQLIWSFPDFSTHAKNAIIGREPWRRVPWLLYNRATGEYSAVEFQKFLAGRTRGRAHVVAYAISVFPARLANFVAVAYGATAKRYAQRALFDLLRSPHASGASRWVAAKLGVMQLERQ